LLCLSVTLKREFFNEEGTNHRNHRPGWQLPGGPVARKGYEVHGIIRRASTFNTARIDHLYADPHINGVRMFLHYGDLSDSVNLVKLLYELKPDEIYHLAAQSHVRVSFDIPEYTSDVTGVGTIRILEAIRETGIRSRFYQASSSEMFGKVQEVPQTETTPFWPRSPVRRCESFRLLGDGELSRSYGLCASQRDSFQSREPAARRDFRHAQNHSGGCRIKHGLQNELFSATSTHNATGATRRNTSKACGASCNMIKAMICVHGHKRNAHDSRIPRHRVRGWISTGNNTSSTISATSVQRR
jgi:hypothetical protein